MVQKLTSIVITGASGFIGRYILDNIKEEYNIFAIARRSRKEANIPYHHNLHWIQCDIANWTALSEVMKYIADNGGANFVIHLAAFYDFTYKDNPEYERTNIKGTENILEFARNINVKRFLFASSVAACKFPTDGEVINEKSIPDADYAYARSKKYGEELIKQYSQYFPCSVIRFAAVFSDWCEYAPLYKFLSRWLSKKIDSRILGGKGDSAIPYIHIHDLCQLLRNVFKKTNELPDYDIYNASPDGSTSHRELFEIVTRYYFGESIKPIYLPKLLAYPGIILRKLLQQLHLTCNEPFERFWMIKYIDLKLDTDSFYTRNALGWNTTSRYHITRRLLFLLEKMKGHPDEWRVKNEAALKRVTGRANLQIYEEMIRRKEKLLAKISSTILSADEEDKFKRYKLMNHDDFQCYMSTLYHLLMAAVRSSDRSLMLQYIDDIAIRRFAEGFEPEELCNTLLVFKEIIITELTSTKELRNIKQDIYDYIGLTIQLAQDEIEDLYENLLQKMPRDKIAESSMLPDCKELQRKIRQLSAFYQISPDEAKNYTERFDN